MPTGGRGRDTRVERERTRLYEARLRLHDGQRRRRTRDNMLAAVVGGILILGVVGGQVAFFTVGPGRPVEPTPTPTPSSTPLPGPLLDPSATPAPTPPAEETPAG